MDDIIKKTLLHHTLEYCDSNVKPIMLANAVFAMAGTPRYTGNTVCFYMYFLPIQFVFEPNAYDYWHS